MCDRPALSNEEIEITAEMVEAGESVLWRELGGFPTLAADFSAPEMAKKVFLAMASHRPKERGDKRVGVPGP